MHHPLSGRRSAVFFLLSWLLLLNACEKVPQRVAFDHPLDPASDQYKAPKATIISGPADGATLSSNQVFFEWEGRLAETRFSSSFDYRLAPQMNQWRSTDNQQLTFDQLADDSYTFYIRERYPTDSVQVDPTQRSFRIDVIDGPAFLLKRFHSLEQIRQGDTLELILQAEEFENVMGLKTVLSFPIDSLKMLSAKQTEGILNRSACSGVPFVSSPADSANQDGMIELSAIRLGGDPVAVSGSGPVARIRFRALKAGDASVDFIKDACTIRDGNNQSIPLNTTVGLTVTIE